MLSIGSQPILFYTDPVDMRKSFDGLSGIVTEAFPGKLLTGSVFVFVNRRRNLMKVLYWDYDGFAVYAELDIKRLMPCAELCRVELHLQAVIH